MKKSLLLIYIITYSAMGQSLSVFDVDASNFPKIKAKFYAFDRNGQLLRNLDTNDFELWENELPRNVTYVNCPIKPPQALSSVLVFDMSASMIDGPPRIQSAKNAANAWINGLPLGISECALISFNDISYIIQDFTTNREKLKVAINKLTPSGGTSYSQALIEYPAGGLQVAKYGKYKKVIVFLTDGQPNTPPDVNEIIKFANDNQITIYAATLDMPAPKSVKDISLKTGGMYFENISTKEEAEDTYKKLLHLSQGTDPCEIEWQSGASCVAGITNVEIQITNFGITTNTIYQSPNTAIAKLEFSPISIKFINPAPGVQLYQKAIVTARNANFKVTNIISNNGAFEITPRNFLLNSGESKELTFSYLPADSGYVFARFIIENDICPTHYYASGGWRGIRPKVRTLMLIHPNGGESLIAGSDTVITWEGVLPDEPVKLEYRIDDTEPWITIADSLTGLSYNWQVPNTPSNQCLARVTAKALKSLHCDNPDVDLCGKIWMGCNLDVEHYRNGEPIRHARTEAEWIDAGIKKEGAWCFYDNDTSNGEIYGKLYNGFAVNDPRGLAPVRWKIPSDTEWSELANCLGGSNVAGGKLKAIGTIESGDGLWHSPNDGATNESWFSALPGGSRSEDGKFEDIGFNCNLFAEENDDMNVWYRNIRYFNISVVRNNSNKFYGYSVRCVRD